MLNHLFAGLFGTAGDAGEYAETIRRGGTVVVVDAPDEAAAEKAHAVLRAQEGAGQVDRDDIRPLLIGQVVDRDVARAGPRVVEQ